MVFSLLEVFGDGVVFRVYVDWLGLFFSLFGVYLLLWFKYLVELCFCGFLLVWLVWLLIFLILLGEGWSLLVVIDDVLQGWNWQVLVYFVLFVLIGVIIFWLGLCLFKQENFYLLLWIMVWLDIVGGVMLVLVLLLVLVVLLLLVVIVVMVLVCWCVVWELEWSQWVVGWFVECLCVRFMGCQLVVFVVVLLWLFVCV